MSDVDQGQLNLQGINVIRIFRAAARPILWGARTTATDPNWQYVNIRRLFLFLEESIQEGIAWAVFEPNNLQLWQKLKRTHHRVPDAGLARRRALRRHAGGSVLRAHRRGAQPLLRAGLGRLHIEIGVRPTYPAEFIVVRIGIWHGGCEVTEA